MGLSTLIILVASINAAERERKRLREGNQEQRDVIGRDQAYRFPLIASCALLAMFLAFKYLPKDWVSFLLTIYGVTFGGLAFSNVIAALLDNFSKLPPIMKKEYGIESLLTFTLCDVIGLIIAAPVTYWYYVTKAWLSNNILASALALSAVDMLAIPDFQSAAVLLCGLFVYDIFWVFGSRSVFGSNVMVSVAKQFEGPIKLVFPRFVGAGPRDTSMLGLGDIVIPGLFVALMLRFDLRNLDLSAPIPYRLPYFFAAIFSYVAGLIATYVALTVFEAAQPALLYLVPACLLTAIGMAAAKKELGMLLAYTEEETKEEKTAGIEKPAAAGEESTTTEVAETKKDQ